MSRPLLQLATARCARQLPCHTLRVISSTVRSSAWFTPRSQIRSFCLSMKNMAAPSDTTTPKPSVSITDLLCPTCQQGYIDKSALEAHQKSLCHGSSRCCRLCNKRFVDRYALYQHMVSPRHNTSPWTIVTFHCDGCGTTYLTYGDLEGHYRAVHHGVAGEG